MDIEIVGLRKEIDSLYSTTGQLINIKSHLQNDEARAEIDKLIEKQLEIIKKQSQIVKNIELFLDR